MNGGAPTFESSWASFRILTIARFASTVVGFILKFPPTKNLRVIVTCCLVEEEDREGEDEKENWVDWTCRGMKSSGKCGVDKMISRDSEWQGCRVVDFFSLDHIERLLNLRLGHLTTFPN
jgi:hypothetical protein